MFTSSKNKTENTAGTTMCQTLCHLLEIPKKGSLTPGCLVGVQETNQ